MPGEPHRGKLAHIDTHPIRQAHVVKDYTYPLAHFDVITTHLRVGDVGDGRDAHLLPARLRRVDVPLAVDLELRRLHVNGRVGEVHARARVRPRTDLDVTRLQRASALCEYTYCTREITKHPYKRHDCRWLQTEILTWVSKGK